jgi:transposase
MLEAGLTVEEAAARIGCSVNGLRLWLRRDHRAQWDAFRVARRRRNATARVTRSRRKRRALALVALLDECPARWHALRKSQRDLAASYGFDPARHGM